MYLKKADTNVSNDFKLVEFCSMESVHYIVMSRNRVTISGFGLVIGFIGH
jgi:hypothetical protein